MNHITKTRLYNFDPLKPYFYIVKLGFTVVYIIFLTSTHNLCFEQKYEKFQIFFLSENFPFLVVKFSIYLNRRVFVMTQKLNNNISGFIRFVSDSPAFTYR